MNRVVCAWCNTVIREGNESISHGICPACLQKQEAYNGPTQATIEAGKEMDRERRREQRDVRRGGPK